jgi:hypothetical protein
MPAPCAWCDADTMDWNASPNGKDICNNCEDEILDSETCELCSAVIEGGNPFSTRCDKCLGVNS